MVEVLAIEAKGTAGISLQIAREREILRRLGDVPSTSAGGAESSCLFACLLY